jgi:glutathione S-transferase
MASASVPALPPAPAQQARTRTALELWYFAHRGRADATLVLLRLGGADVCCNWFDYPTFLKLRDRFPFGLAPALSVPRDGGRAPLVLAESRALARFAAHAAKLVPLDALEAARADMCVDALMDMKTIGFFAPGTPADLLETCSRQLRGLCTKLDAMLVAESCPWLAGREMSWADVVFFCEVDLLAGHDGGAVRAWLAADFARLARVYDAVRALPIVQAVLQSDEWRQGLRWSPFVRLAESPPCGCVHECACAPQALQSCRAAAPNPPH